MKKITLSAIVLGALIGAATAQAGDYRYAGGGCSGPAYEATTLYVRPSWGYAFGTGYGNNYGYGQHRVLHQDLEAGHQDLHMDLMDTHQDAHRELRHERAHGASGRELRAEHQEIHYDLSDAHQDGHVQLRGDHRTGHYDLGW